MKNTAVIHTLCWYVISSTMKTAKIIKRWHYHPPHQLHESRKVKVINFLWFLLFLINYLLNVVVDLCVNRSFFIYNCCFISSFPIPMFPIHDATFKGAIPTCAKIINGYDEGVFPKKAWYSAASHRDNRLWQFFDNEPREAEGCWFCWGSNCHHHRYYTTYSAPVMDEQTPVQHITRQIYL